MALRTIRKVQTYKVNALLILPKWESQPCIPVLRQLPIQKTWNLVPMQNILQPGLGIIQSYSLLPTGGLEAHLILWQNKKLDQATCPLYEPGSDFLFNSNKVILMPIEIPCKDPLIKATLKALDKQSPEKPRKKRYTDPEPVLNWLEQQQLLELNDKQILQRLSVQFILLHAFRFADCERMKWTDIEIEDDSFTIRVPAKSDLTIMKETTITRNTTRKGVCTLQTIENWQSKNTAGN
ncbi:MAG: hypothetical protein EZS28_024616 [Streblomastix strix]|uniref:Uncharacterized protein n=1 Tax=Streblomastix strix TaxID=222440 RepID=A0A5J4VBC7_9EUKA|nr:MAG: hypothetical protein EZS28_024616 [Streblomastix strix]